jgi:hypothetical protein
MTDGSTQQKIKSVTILKRVWMSLKVTFVILGIWCFVYGVFLGGCEPDYAKTRPASSDRNKRLTEAELISAAMFVYADRHNGTLPPSLEALKPDYLGQSVDTSFLSYHTPGSKLETPYDYRVIASETQHDADHKFICIYGHRGVSLLREGD